MPDDSSDEETCNSFYPDERNFYKVDMWTRDGTKIDTMLYTGNSLGKAQQIFAAEIRRRPRIASEKVRMVEETFAPGMTASPPTMPAPGEGTAGRAQLEFMKSSTTGSAFLRFPRQSRARLIRHSGTLT
jgi:hypothetical protein